MTNSLKESKKSLFFRIIGAIKSIQYIGVTENLEQYEKRRIVLTNYSFSFAAISYALLMVMYASKGMIWSVAMLLVGFLVCTFSLYLNHRGRTILSAFIAVNITITIVFVNALMVKSDGTIGNEFISLSLLSIIPLGFSMNYMKLIIFSMSATALSGFSIVFFKVHEFGIYALSAEKALSLSHAKYIQASIAMCVALFIFIRERNRSFKLHEVQQLKIVNQSRLSDLGVMSAGIAHEINNPLTVIMANIGFVKKQLQKQECYDTFYEGKITKLLLSCDRVSKIISGIRVISRDGTRDPYVKTSLNDTITKVVDIVEARFKQGSIQLNVSLSDDDEFFMGREVQIEQVLVALLSNASDEVRDLEKPWVTISTAKNEEFHTISVTDSGAGIPPEIKKTIFNPFFTTKPVGKGTGLGLSVAQGILEEHGGALLLDESNLNTSFIMKLPKIS